MSTKSKEITGTIAAFGLALIVASGNIGLAMAASDSERYNIGHHEGALQASLDEQAGIYNSDCYRYTTGPHTSTYCNGYGVGYDVNWHIFKDRNLHLGNFNSNVQANQNINQKAQINCFLAICNNHVNQKGAQDQNIDTNTATAGS